MPLNASHYLTKHGWKGHGTPLDGEKGRGLKKPLIIPQKRNLGGIGQNRDRAVEWWDDIFAAGAKALALGTNAKKESNTPAGPRRTLSSLAKQEHARRMLMSNFVRGEVVGTLSISEETETNVTTIQETTDGSPSDTRDVSVRGAPDDERTSAQNQTTGKRQRDDDDAHARKKKKKSKSEKSTKSEKSKSPKAKKTESKREKTKKDKSKSKKSKRKKVKSQQKD